MSASPPDRPSASAPAATESSSPQGSGARVEVEVNGDPRDLPTGATVTTLLEDLGLGGKRVAVAVNRTVLVRSRYEEVELSAGDRIEILEAVGGG